jgi:hypothetical protein
MRLNPLWEKKNRIVAILVAYGLSVWALWALLPPRPRLSITLQERANAVVISRDGRSLVTESDGPSENPSSRLCVWDLRNGRLKAELPVISGPIWEVIVSPDGSLVAAKLGSKLEREGRLPILHVYEIETGQEMNRFLLSDVEGFHGGDACFSPDGSTLAFATDVQNVLSVILWDVPSRQVRAVLQGQHGPLAFSPDGRTLATVIMSASDTQIKVWDVMTGRERLTLDQPRIDYKEEMVLTSIIPHLAFSIDGGTLGMIGFISPTDHGRVVEELERGLKGDYEERPPSHLIRTWDTVTGRVQAERLSSYVFSTASTEIPWDGVYILEYDQDQGEERLLDPVSGTERFRLPVRGEPDYAQSCVSMGPWFGVRPAPERRLIMLQRSWFDLSSGGWQDWLAKVIPHWNSARRLQWSLSLYDLCEGRHLATLSAQSCGCFSPDGQVLATMSNDDKTVSIWDIPPSRPWLAIFGWAVLPAGLLILVERWRLRHARA